MGRRIHCRVHIFHATAREGDTSSWAVHEIAATPVSERTLDKGHPKLTAKGFPTHCFLTLPWDLGNLVLNRGRLPTQE